MHKTSLGEKADEGSVKLVATFNHFIIKQSPGGREEKTKLTCQTETKPELIFDCFFSIFPQIHYDINFKVA